MVETIDKAWINLWLPELNEPQVTMLLAHIEARITDARVDELERMVETFEWGNGTDNLTDRIKELKENK
jgi:hypothetical protein